MTDTFGWKAGSYLSALLLCEELVRLGLGVKCFAQSTALDASYSPRHALVRPLLRRGWRWDWPGKCLAWQARRSIRQDHPDFVLVCGVDRLARYLLQSDAAARLLIWENTNANPGNKFVDPQAIHLLERARALLSPSATIDQCVRQTYGYAGPLLRLPFWVEDLQQPFASTPANFANDFVFLGRLDDEKGVRELLRATAVVVKRFPEVRVMIAGPGDDQPYRKLAAGLRVTRNVTHECFGHNRQLDKLRALALSRCLVLPSYHEGYPLVLLEAAQCSVPFIATRVGSVPELYEGSPAALLVPAKDHVALASAMETMLSEPRESYEKRRQAAFDVFSRLSSRAVIQSRLRDLLERAG